MGCDLPEDNVLSLEDLPEGSSAIECDAVGRTVESSEGELLDIPPLGFALTVESLPASGAATSFTISTESDGDILYDESSQMLSEVGDDKIEDELDGASAKADITRGCDRTTYVTRDVSWGQSHWRWHIGDGKRPDGITSAWVYDIVSSAADRVTEGRNACGMPRYYDLHHDYIGPDSHESDFEIEDGVSKCADYDGKNTIDFGNLDKNGDPPVATTCIWWTNTNHRIYSADIRFNTTDFKFVNGVSSCTNQFDLGAVATHEIGHVYGLKDLYGYADRYLTMYGTSFRCKVLARSLGKGDYMGLSSL